MDLVLAMFVGALFGIFISFFIVHLGPWMMGWRSVTYSKYWPYAKELERIDQEIQKYGDKAKI